MDGYGSPAGGLRLLAVDVGGRTLWSGVDLSVAPGEFVAVLGPNGVGKSTLVKAVLGLQPVTGRVEVLGAQALHEHLRQAGERIALTTVYRALHSYARVGRIDTTFDADGEQLFRAGRGHYLVCRACRRAIPVDASAVTDWADAQAADHGFTDIHPVIELAGLCPECAGDQTWAPGRSSGALSSA